MPEGRLLAQPALRDAFELLRTTADEDIDVIEAALLVARSMDDDAPVQRTLDEANALAEEAQQWVHSDAPAGFAAELCEFLCGQAGFIGSTDYYSADNSALNRVFATRQGIPISLAVVYIGTAQRLQRSGFLIQGVNFPSHFLVRIAVRGSGDSVLIDPYAGAITTEQACEQRLQQMHANLHLQDEHLQAATAVQIVVRMLGNLKLIHLNEGAFEKALHFSDQILWLMPDHPQEFRDRAVLLEQAGSLAAAAFELERLLPYLGDEMSRRTVRQKIGALREAGS